MKNISKMRIFLFCLICCFLIPNVKGIERMEETLYCTRGIHYPIFDNVEIEKDEVITWDFTTYNSSFEAILALWISTYTFVVDLSLQQTNDKGEYRITQTGYYRFTVGNFGQNDGYIHIVIENKKGVSSYPLFLMFGIIGIATIVKTIKIKRLK